MSTYHNLCSPGTVIGGFTFLVSGENFLKLDNPPDILAWLGIKKGESI